MATGPESFEEFSKEELQNLKQLAQDVDQAANELNSTRREVIKSLGLLGTGIAAGGISAQELINEVSAQASTTDGDGNVGLPSDRVDVYADGLDGNSASLGSLNADEESITEPVVRAYFGGIGTYRDYKISDYSDIGDAVNQPFADAPSFVYVELPKGDFTFTTTIEPPADGAIIKGVDGTTKPTLRWNNTDSTAIDATTNTAQLIVRDLNINATTSGTTGVDTDQTVRLINCEWRGFGPAANIRGVAGDRDANYCVVHNCNFANGVKGIKLNGNRFTMSDTRLGSNTTGLEIDGGTGVTVKDCSIGTNDYGIVTGSDDAAVLTIKDTYFESNTEKSVELDGGIEAVRLMGNRFGAQNGPNVHIKDVKYGQIGYNRYRGDGNLTITSSAELIDVYPPAGSRTVNDNSTRKLRAGKEILLEDTLSFSGGQTRTFTIPGANLGDNVVVTATPANDPNNNHGYVVDTKIWSDGNSALRATVSETSNSGGGTAEIVAYQLDTAL